MSRIKAHMALHHDEWEQRRKECNQMKDGSTGQIPRNQTMTPPTKLPSEQKVRITVRSGETKVGEAMHTAWIIDVGGETVDQALAALRAGLVELRMIASACGSVPKSPEDVAQALRAEWESLY